MQVNKQYHLLSQILHWCIATLILLQFLLAEFAEHAAEANAAIEQLRLLAHHKSIGMTILFLSCIRLSVRYWLPRPAKINSVPPWQQRAGQLSHIALYFLIFAIPLSGWLQSSAAAYSVSWFNIFSFPDLIGASDAGKSFWHDVHEILFKALLVIVVVHILAALKHHFLAKNDVLIRMLSWPSLCLATTLFLAGLWFLGLSDNQELSQSGTEKTPKPLDETTGTNTASRTVDQTSTQAALPLEILLAENSWDIDYTRSYIKFTAVQAGAEFTGAFTQWLGDIRIDPTQENNRIHVMINLNSVNSDNQERDTTLLEQDFFDVDRHPSAWFFTDSITQAQNSTHVKESQAIGTYLSKATLRLKGLDSELKFMFTAYIENNRKVLRGHATIDRIAISIGTGQWLDTDWIGQDVVVNVEVQSQEIAVSP